MCLCEGCSSLPLCCDVGGGSDVGGVRIETLHFLPTVRVFVSPAERKGEYTQSRKIFFDYVLFVLVLGTYDGLNIRQEPHQLHRLFARYESMNPSNKTLIIK